MDIDPITLWAIIRPLEESSGLDESEENNLANAEDNRLAIFQHIEMIENLLPTMDAGNRARYFPWVLDCSSYQYSTEAYYQSRILRAIAKMGKTAYRTDDRKIVCARQVLRPSAFNKSPRIKRVNCNAYVIFPLPTMYWMYEILSMAALTFSKQPINKDMLKKYLLYTHAIQCFLRWSDFRSAYKVDYFLSKVVSTVIGSGREEAANIGLATKTEKDVVSLAVFLTYAIEEFIINHEIAHLALEHQGTSSVIIESEADQRAVQTMNAIGFNRIAVQCVNKTGETLDVNAVALGYLCLRLWSNFRLMAEATVVPWAYQEDHLIVQEKNRLHKLFEDRVLQTNRNPLIGQIVGQPIYKDIIAGFDSLIQELINIDVPNEMYTELSRIAKSLAEKG